tara:strand:- start:63 stop:791 length:729 start_codon:yes stop_codon:yes gene_type:complete
MTELSSNVALSSQMVLQRDFEITTNNIANMKTGGFERRLMPYSEAKVNPALGKKYSFVEDLAVIRDLSPGVLQSTGDPFHVYASQGYFGVNTPEGVRYTKNGAFTLNDESMLVTAQGHPVLDNNNAPIILPEGTVTINIASDGTISDQNGLIAQLGRFNFENPYDMTALEDTLFETQQAAFEDTKARITQGGYDGGNVNPVIETTKMTYLLRRIQHTQKIIEGNSQLESMTTQKLLKTASAA